MPRPTNGNNTLTWVLPDVVDPPDTICVTIHIPNNKLHIAAFKGAMFDLSCWWNWERDNAHTATRVARVWRKIFYALKFGCEPDKTIIYEESSNMPPFRMDCDGKLYVVDCDGVEHCIAYCADIPAGIQPGAGTPQPAVGGGSQKYCYQLQADNALLLPAVVNSGDVIELTDAHGTGNDGGRTTWYCHDGAISIGPFCSPTGGPVGGDPMPGENHMSLIVNIAGTFYSLEHGPFTVPGGVSNAQAVVQVNDSAIDNNLGAYDVCITITNNQQASWSHLFNFALNDFGFAVVPNGARPDTSAFVGGTGFVSAPASDGSGGAYGGVHREKPIASATTVTHVRVVFNTTSAEGLAPRYISFDDGATTHAIPDGSGDQAFDWNGTEVNPASLLIHIYEACNPCGSTGVTTLKSVLVEGTGADPF